MVNDRSLLSDRIITLLGQSAGNLLKMGDYITMLQPEVSTPFHGLMVVGWQEALDCRAAIFINSEPASGFRRWNVQNFAEQYNVATGDGTALNDPVPWVVDFTAPPNYANNLWINELDLSQ